MFGPADTIFLSKKTKTESLLSPWKAQPIWKSKPVSVYIFGSYLLLYTTLLNPVSNLCNSLALSSEDDISTLLIQHAQLTVVNS